MFTVSIFFVQYWWKVIFKYFLGQFIKCVYVLCKSLLTIKYFFYLIIMPSLFIIISFNSLTYATAPNYSPCKPKRSLKFDSPNVKAAKDLNSSAIEPFDSPEKPLNGGRLSNGSHQRSEKRLRSEDEYANLSGSDQDEDFPTLSMYFFNIQCSYIKRLSL